MTTTPAATGGLTPIETEYSGYKFRSRLEARWALYFDLCKIPWQYEVEGYTLSDGQRYLPDFWLPDYNQFVEVKPNTDVQTSDRDCVIDKYDHIIYDYGDTHDIDVMLRTLVVTIGDRLEASAAVISDLTYLEDWADQVIVVVKKGHTFPDIPKLKTIRDATFADAMLLFRKPKKCFLALREASGHGIGFRIVFGDPREKLQVSNRQTRELPFNEVAATAARQHRFEGARK
jgi:hypothetical protein